MHTALPAVAGVSDHFRHQHDLQQAPLQQQHSNLVAYEVCRVDRLFGCDPNLLYVQIIVSTVRSENIPENIPENPNPLTSLGRLHIEKGAVREVVPIRPVAVLGGSVSLQSKQVMQLV